MNIYIVSGEAWSNNGVLFASTNKEEAESFLNSFNNIDENGERIFDVFYFETFNKSERISRYMVNERSRKPYEAGSLSPVLSSF